MSNDDDESEAVHRITFHDLRARQPSAINKLKEALLSPTLGYFELDCGPLEVAGDVRVGDFDVRRTYDAAKEFFSLSTEVKQQYVHTQYSSESGGYVPFLEEYSYVANTAALVESFDCVRDLKLEDLRRVRESFGADAARGLGPMDWPVEVSDMKEAFQKFYAACDEVATVLLQTVAIALDLHETEFSQHFGDTAHCSMRAMRYPAIEQIESKRRKSNRISGAKASSTVELVGIAEHTDFEFITLLHQTCRGLELKGRDGRWRLAPAYPDSPLFTVIFADALEYFTNGLVRATPHRVLPSRDGVDRYSLVRFNGLNDSAKVAPLAKFVCVERPMSARYAATTQGDHIGKLVTRASDNLAAMLEKNEYVKTALTSPPRRFAQMLIVAGDRILLGKHTSGEFAERFTGFISEIDQNSELQPVDVARTTAVRRGGLNPAAFDALDQQLCVREIGRFRFTGWHQDTLVVEHEFVAIFEKDSPVLARLFDREGESDAQIDMIPTWFRLDEIPYEKMPDDDEKWYPLCLARAGIATGAGEHARLVNELVIGHFCFENDAIASWSARPVPFKMPERVEVWRLPPSCKQQKKN